MIPVEQLTTLLPFAAIPALATTILRLEGIKRIKNISIQREAPSKKGSGKSSVDQRVSAGAHFVQVATGGKAEVTVEAADGPTTILVDDNPSSLNNKFTQSALISVNGTETARAQSFKITRVNPQQTSFTAEVLHLPFLPGFAANPAQDFRDHRPSGERRMRL